jgi:hypothetical protein
MEVAAGTGNAVTDVRAAQPAKARIRPELLLTVAAVILAALLLIVLV